MRYWPSDFLPVNWSSGVQPVVTLAEPDPCVLCVTPVNVMELIDRLPVAARSISLAHCNGHAQLPAAKVP